MSRRKTERLRVLRVYHAGRDPAHRRRERALVEAGVDVTLVVPSLWPDHGAENRLSEEPFPIYEAAVRRAGDVNRHTYVDRAELRRIMDVVQPQVLDLHEEPVSAVTRQWLRVARDVPVVMYTAQNIDKRYPPPFAQYEKAALRRAAASYPCSRQAASVLRGKGFGGRVDVLPLGVDTSVFVAGDQAAGTDTFALALVGRLVPEKGVLDAVQVLAGVQRIRPSRLVLVGQGPQEQPARQLAARLGVGDRLDVVPWSSAAELARIYRGSHVVLMPSSRTATWVEQFGRVILEAQASGAVLAGYASGTIPDVAGPAGVLVPEGDVRGLEAEVTRLARDGELLARLRSTGLVNAAATSWAAVAARQAAQYRHALEAPAGSVAGTEGERRTSRERRSAAVAEFGSPSSTRAGARPFAVPLLRDSPRTATVAGRLVDGAVDLRDAVVNGRRR